VLTAANRLFLARGKKFFELAAVKPHAVAVRAGVQNNGPVNATVNTQQLSRIARAPAPRIVGLLVLAASTQRIDPPGILGQELAQLLPIEPNSRARRAAIDGDAFDRELSKIFVFALWTFHGQR
jgi:hypothetical protein